MTNKELADFIVSYRETKEKRKNMDIKNMTTEELGKLVIDVQDELYRREEEKRAKAIEDFNTAVKNLAKVMDHNFIIPYEKNDDFSIDLRDFKIKYLSGFNSDYVFTGLDY